MSSRQPPQLRETPVEAPPAFSEEWRWHVLRLNARGRLFGFQLPRSESTPATFDEDFDLASDFDDQETRYSEQARRYVRKMLARVRDFPRKDWEKQCAPEGNPNHKYPEQDGKRKLLIFIHGGLNSLEDSLERAKKLYLPILCTGYYPIFINWNSGLVSSYWEHLVHIRQGKYYQLSQNTLSRAFPLIAPLYLFSDLLGSIAKSPLSTGELTVNDVEGFKWCNGQNQKSYGLLCGEGDSPEIAAKYLNKKIKEENKDANWNLEVESDSREWHEQGIDLVRLLVSSPSKTVIAAAAVQAGAEGWTDMLRRIEVTFRTDEDFRLPQEAYQEPSRIGYRPITGGLAIFFRALVNATKEKQTDNEDQQQTPVKITKADITLVGHSMGAILANRIIRRFGQQLPISHIVYMGAACTIKDYEETAWPYIRSRQLQEQQLQKWSNTCHQELATICPKDTQQNKTCQKIDQSSAKICDESVKKTTQRFPVPEFYNLMLHPKMEALEKYSVVEKITGSEISAFFERNVVDFFPRGSLLIWLDGFLTSPPSPIDRMLGRFTNYMLTADRTPSDVSSMIHPKVFGMDDKNEPTQHGDFARKLKFWKPECWQNGTEAHDCQQE